MSHELWFRTPAPDWFEALPIGNGHLGAKVFGRVEDERIALNLDDVWSGAGPRELEVTDGPEVLADIRRLLLEEGDQYAASERSRALQGPLVESYQPLGDLLITSPGDAAATEYRRSLDLRTGVVAVDYARDGVRFHRESYVSTPDQVMVWIIGASQPGSVDLDLTLTSQHPFIGIADGDGATLVGRAPSDLTIEYRRSPDPIRYEEGLGIGFGVALRAFASGGTVTASEAGLSVRGADSLTVLLSAASTFRGWSVAPGDNPEEALHRATAALEAVDLDNLKQRHLDDHIRLYDRAELTLGDPVDLPTDERLRAVAAGGTDPGLSALIFGFGRYLLMASSRPGTQAANLQGIWNEDRRPMWASDWTNNINTQMNYWPADVTGLRECFDPLTQLVTNLASSGAETARILYDAPGWVSHHNSDLWMASWPVGAGGDDPVWSMAPTCGVWLSAQLMEHHRFHPDQDFLREKLYPVLRGAAEFVLSMLVEDREGRLQFIPSTAPEHHFVLPSGQKASVDLTTTYDLWVIQELFANVLEAEAELGLSSELAARAETAVLRLPPVAIAEDGRMMEWQTDWPPSEFDHRHQSHLYGLYPGAQIDPAVTPQWASAVRASLDVRTSGRPPGGWTSAWLIALWGRLLDSEKAAAVLRDYTSRLVSDNLLHRDGDIFQIDANFGLTAAMAELLIQSHTDVIHLLPALPAEWSDGSYRGLRARGGLAFDVSWAAGEVTSAAVVADVAGTFTVRIAGGTPFEITMSAGERVQLPERR
ncbi:glycoside hydrolase family 95 protein [Kribbella sp. CA-293567]|uniref:glycoside hydrolase family 95 protein n=1 Tax=Kribbella sp. CA-293567 TaxID=3002436 RepID=UPI0022DE644F|nr:glycoside hydrolase family 95 protein [Kribbella sp. CA-293567]WBQ03202.1 glycoside hydrolase family 95 protein [Kribbella sp. CA-293567]